MHHSSMTSNLDMIEHPTVQSSHVSLAVANMTVLGLRSWVSVKADAYLMMTYETRALIHM